MKLCCQKYLFAIDEVEQSLRYPYQIFILLILLRFCEGTDDQSPAIIITTLISVSL